MTKADLYLKDGVDVEEFVSKFDEYYDTKAENYIGTKIDFLKAFLRESVKPTLTEDEKVILRNVDKMYTIIGRAEYGVLEFYRSDGHYTTSCSCYPLNHLFQFIQPRRRI